MFSEVSLTLSIGLVEKLFVIGPLSSFQAWESEFESCFNDEEIKLSFIVDYNSGHLVHNFNNWNFLSKFKNLKILEFLASMVNTKIIQEDLYQIIFVGPCQT